MNQGLGRRLVERALASVAANEPETATVNLVGDLAYYGRLGFVRVPHRQIALPGPVDRERLLVWRGPEGDRAIPCGMMRTATLR